MTTKEYEKRINEHCEKRNKYEEKADEIVNKFISTYFGDYNWTVTRTKSEWEHYDYIISQSKVEFKQRWFKDINQYNKYKEEGFCLSYDKINNADVILYHIPITNEMLYIKCKLIKELYNANQIKLVKKKVNKYQFTDLGKHEENLLLIPYKYFTIYKM